MGNKRHKNMDNKKGSPWEVWEEIKDKVQLYQTAKFGVYHVKILGVACKGTFTIRHPVWGEMHVGCQELTDYCL
jgi:hypothetical protein